MYAEETLTEEQSRALTLTEIRQITSKIPLVICSVSLSIDDGQSGGCSGAWLIVRICDPEKTGADTNKRHPYWYHEAAVGKESKETLFTRHLCPEMSDHG